MMIHCSLAHSGAWQGVALRLQRQAQLLAFDQPGHGGSGPWHGDQVFQEQAMEMALGLIAMWDDAPVHLVGHSFGGTVALRMAAEYPDKVLSVALYEPVFFTAGFRAFPGLEAEHDALMAGYDSAWKAGDAEGAARAFLDVWGDGRAWEKLPEVQRADFARRIAVIDAIRETNYGDPGGLLQEGRLAALPMPVLLMEGARSPVLATRINDALAALLPRARRQVFEGAGHMGPITHAPAVAEALRDFIGI
ncbi:alpha/beta hydrolase [Pseudooceanicola sp. CBS1P-1]|uniref:Alpha/beta fold hydrolase n=1 Tax=Pseudooceanicola albus TaxID=2692189 RepID=A0A6L7G0Y7_9RHOB|nr:alpha/beta hydrolase [Pseudooceanicola endophyticus]MXN17158.1 alpha/beta fold hydrolase [Pseudooceanicola albus]